MPNETEKKPEEKQTTEKEPEAKVEYPNIVERFREVFQKLGIKKSEGYVDHCAKGDLENLEDVEEKLYQMGLHPSLRNQVVNFWAAEIEAPIPEKLRSRLTEERGVKDRTEKGKKQAEGTVWTVDIDDSGLPRIRMIRDESEPGVTLAEAKAAGKEIGREGEQSIAIYNEELGRHMPNFKSPFVKQNLAAAWATARTMDKAMAEGAEVDPMDIWIDQQVKLGQLKEVMGVTPELREKTPVGEIVSALKDLQEMAKEGKAVEMPSWMTDPLKFIETVRAVSGEGDKGKPEWMTDPIKFIETIRAIVPEQKTDEGLKTELSEMRQTIKDMSEQRHQDQVTAQQAQIKGLTDKLSELMEVVVDLKKPVTGRTEMDIIHDVAAGVLEEAKGLRTDIKGTIRDTLGSGGLPATKGAEEREKRKGKYAKALESDKKVEDLGRDLFFTEG